MKIISHTHYISSHFHNNTVEPLYSGHHWDHSKYPDFKGFLISGVDFIHICMYLWQNQVFGFEGCLDLRVSGVRGFTVLQCNWYTNGKDSHFSALPSPVWVGLCVGLSVSLSV